MNDEAAWQAYLDANPEDHQGRTVYADWLDDRDDPRAAGMRAMGRLGLKAWYFCGSEDWGWFGPTAFADWYLLENPELNPSILPLCWEEEIEKSGQTRAAAENAAAIAWARLTPQQQAEILSRVEVTATQRGAMAK